MDVNHLERKKMAQCVAHITSGIDDALPEPDDFALADKLILIVESQIRTNNLNRRVR